MSLFRPKKLKEGDTVGLVGTSGHTGQDILDAAVNSLNELGLKVKIGESCTLKHGYFSGHDRARAHDVNAMFADPSVDAVFAMRGGYGCSRLLGLIDLNIIRKNLKFFCGYSDITFLHILFNQQCGLETYHTPMPTTELYKGLDDYSMSYYKKVLFGTGSADGALGEVFNPSWQKLETLTKGYAEGVITGGNLSVLVSTLGTPTEIDCKNKILFLEDVDENVYRVDRMISQLKNAGKLDDACGIILGGFTNCETGKNKESLSLSEVFEELITQTGKPAVTGLSLGHCTPTMSIPLGATVRLDATECRIIFE